MPTLTLGVKEGKGTFRAYTWDTAFRTWILVVETTGVTTYEAYDGEYMKFEAIPDPGYGFERFCGCRCEDAQTTDNPFTATITVSGCVYAFFLQEQQPPSYTYIGVYITPESTGSVTVSYQRDGQPFTDTTSENKIYEVDSGSSFTVESATPAEGYIFTNLYIDGIGDVEPPYTFTADVNRSIYAYFTEKPEQRLVIIAEDRSGMPVTGAEVTVLDTAGRIVASGVTDQSGAADLGEVQAETEQVIVNVFKDDPLTGRFYNPVSLLPDKTGAWTVRGEYTEEQILDIRVTVLDTSSFIGQVLNQLFAWASQVQQSLSLNAAPVYMASLFIDALKQEGAEKEVSLLYFTYDPDVAGYRIGVRIKKASPAIPAGAVIALAAAAAFLGFYALFIHPVVSTLAEASRIQAEAQARLIAVEASKEEVLNQLLEEGSITPEQYSEYIQANREALNKTLENTSPVKEVTETLRLLVLGGAAVAGLILMSHFISRMPAPRLRERLRSVGEELRRRFRAS